MFGSQSNAGVFGSATNSNPTGGGLFGNNSATSSNAFGNSFGSSSSNNASSSGLFGKPSTTATSTGGLFGNSATNTQPSLGTTNAQSNTSSGGLFANSNSTQSGTTTGGLFGKPSTATSTGLFGNKPAGGFFGNPQQSSSIQPSSGLFGNSGPTKSNFSSGGLFGTSSGGLNTNNNLSIGTPPTKQYNFKDLPRPLTDSAKANKTSHHATSTRKRSLSSSSPAPIVTNRSSILQRLGTTFGNIKSEKDYNSQGLFSPRKNLIQSVLSPEKQSNDRPKSNRVVSRSFASSSINARSLRNRGPTTSEFLKLKVDPSRTEARRLKIFGESGGATKVRILGREEENSSLFIPAKNDEAAFESGHDNTVLEDGVPHTEGEAVQEEVSRLEPTTVEKNIQESDYWCSPSIAELLSLRLRQLSEVSGFAIGRKGYGTITFDLPVDLTAFSSDLPGYLFGNIVRFNKNKTVEVYPHGSVPVGTGLNVPATITLEKVFPVSKSKRNVEDSVTKDLELRLFVKKLKELKDMEFVTYDPINGAWTFKVKHFSIWGLVDEDSAVVDIDKELENIKTEKEGSAPPPIEQQEVKIPARSSKPRNNIEDTFIFKRQRQDKTFELGETLQIPGSFIVDNTRDLIRDVKEEEDEHSGENLNTDNILSDEYQNDHDDTLENIPTKLPFNGDESLAEEDEDLAEKQFEPLHLDDKDFEILDADPKLTVSDNWEEQLEISARFDSAFANNYIKRTTIHDAPFSKALTVGELDTLLFGDSNKVYDHKQKIKKELRLDGHNFTFFAQNNRLLVKDINSNSGVSYRQLLLPLSVADRSLAKAVYKKHVIGAVITKRSNDFPKAIGTPTFSFKSIIDTFDVHAEHSGKTVWQLASILFDTEILEDQEVKAITKPEAINRILDIKRRESLLSWIKGEIQDDINTRFDASKDTFEQIFLLLVTLNISGATKLAIKTNNAHLAVLISLLGSNDPEVKYSAQQQIQDWKNNAVLQTIPENLVKIYYLLKGDILTKNSIVDVSEGLSWKAKLSLLLSYGNINDTVTALLTSFIDSQSSIPASDETQFNLLKLFVHVHSGKYDLSSIFGLLRTGAFYDVSLKWYVYEVLVRSSNQLAFSKQTGDKLTSLFAEQLFSQGLFEEAIFILSHLSSDQEVKIRITQLISINIELFSKTPGFIELLISTLKVPKKVILEAKALHARYIGDMWKEVSYLLDAENYEEAHRAIVNRVAPAAVISNGPKIKLLEEFISRFPERHTIKGWATGGAIYKNYVQFLKSRSESSVRYLLDNLPLVELSNFKIRVAINLVSRKVTSKVIDTSKREGSAYLDLDINKVLKLPIGEEGKPYIAKRAVLQNAKHNLTKV